jgi:hypothetical protein
MAKEVYILIELRVHSISYVHHMNAVRSLPNINKIAALRNQHIIMNALVLKKRDFFRQKCDRKVISVNPGNINRKHAISYVQHIKELKII